MMKRAAAILMVLMMVGCVDATGGFQPGVKTNPPGLVMKKSFNGDGGGCGRLPLNETAQGNFRHCLFDNNVCSGGDFQVTEDRARSGILDNVPAGTVIQLYEDKNFGMDWVEIRVKRRVSRRVINSFEQNVDDADISVVFHDAGGGPHLNHEVSSAKITAP